MAAHDHDDVSFGALVGRDRSQIYRIRNGGSRPSDALKVKISEVTKGAVPPEAWFRDVPEQAAAA